MLGRPREILRGSILSTFADANTQTRLADLYTQIGVHREPITVPLRFWRTDGSFAALLAVMTSYTDAGSARRVRLIGLDDRERSGYIAELESKVNMLDTVIETSAEAMWCMEYSEPVNLRSSAQAIVRQVFENKCSWIMCNQAMARLFDLPDGVDFIRQPVSNYFRRNPENEAFVRQLIDANFHIDSAPSLEYRHSGKVIYIENSVRSHIEGDLLLRWWGTVRDITEFRMTQNVLNARRREVTEILSALPDAILVVDISRRAIGVNPAFETSFGWRAEEILGKDVAPIIDLEARQKGEGRWFARTDGRWMTNVTSTQGRVRCEVRIAPVPVDSEPRFVLALRPVLDAALKEPRSKRSTRRKAVNGAPVRRTFPARPQ
jgi:PAS domain S-box-containing protein